ncbi:hypothetical protein SEA_ALI17_46 [Gordonia phage Ali17]|uniref:Uncharacterized protein n=1 Tax=Gordonia phage Ali17 TaxID=2301561 RepID=A0A385DPQ2_9CAUD|nr:hypothetical protein J1772_gp46 [Gordonia phage Ali17]AXQ60662.1 hypothetical protein SEA_ALI17_46 [Gordonia phage Ali17]QXN73267.1 hypothetical protein SEA_HANS_50 [Gordonia phage Hans]
MTGPEHYAKAEQLLRQANMRTPSGEYPEYGDAERAHMIASAQVHATLAQTAATALETVNSGLRPDLDDAVEDTFNDWHTAITGKGQLNG